MTPMKPHIVWIEGKTDVFAQPLYIPTIQYEEMRLTRVAKLVGTFKSMAEAERAAEAALANITLPLEEK